MEKFTGHRVQRAFSTAAAETAKNDFWVFRTYYRVSRYVIKVFTWRFEVSVSFFIKGSMTKVDQDRAY